MTPVRAAVLLFAGLAAGILNAIAGGGSLITFPTLLGIGLPPASANVSNALPVARLGAARVKPACTAA